jgi:aspartate dehydrogenase
LVADPTATTNRHEISASGAFGSLEVAIANNPLPDNPKTSAMAALNLARAINTRVAPIVI